MCVFFFVSEVVLTLSVGNPYDPRGGTCGPGVWRAACLSEVPACSTGWAFSELVRFGFGSCFGLVLDVDWLGFWRRFGV